MQTKARQVLQFAKNHGGKCAFCVVLMCGIVKIIKRISKCWGFTVPRFQDIDNLVLELEELLRPVNPVC
jgi:hypothetical protein